MLEFPLYFFLFLFVFAISTKVRCNSNKCLVGQTAIVTGAKSGLGYETVLNLASRGCKVILADVAEATETADAIIEETGNRNIFYKFLDLASLESVRKFSTDILNSEDRLDILINNAGCGGYEGVYTSDGLLKTMQINYFGHFLLTHLLVDLLKKTFQSRVVFVSSLVAFLNRIKKSERINKPCRWQWMMPPVYWDYGNSKLCMIIASNIFADKLKEYGIKVNAVHPGMVSSGIFHRAKINGSFQVGFSNIYLYLMYFLSKMFGKTPKEGNQMHLHCSLSDDVDSGGFYVDSIDYVQPSAARNSKLSYEIWKLSEELVKLKPEEKL